MNMVACIQLQHERGERRVGNTHGHLSTCLNSDMTSATSPIVIEVVKEGYGQANLACRLVKLEGGNGGKEKGTAPEWAFVQKATLGVGESFGPV